MNQITIYHRASLHEFQEFLFSQEKRTKGNKINVI